MDSRQHKGKVLRDAALVGHGWEIHIQPDIIGQVRLARCHKRARQVDSEIRVDLAVVGESRGCIPRRLRSCGTGESDAGDSGLVHRVRRCTDRAGNQYGQADIASQLFKRLRGSAG